jgi:PTS system mannose-specific IID component
MARLRGRYQSLVRVLGIQATWTYERMQGVGLGHALEPVLRSALNGDESRLREAMGRGTGFFNANPYLAPAAVGALARAEADRVPAAQIERLRTALGGPLGSLGDRLFWTGLMPAMVSGAILGVALGGGIWPALAGVAAYNVIRLGLGGWLLDLGWAHGLRIGTAIGESWLPAASAMAGLAASLLAALALPPALAFLLRGATAPALATAVGLFLAMLAARRIIGRRATAPALTFAVALLMLLWQWGTS